jgi:FkbM family methyltransferase
MLSYGLNQLDVRILRFLEKYGCKSKYYIEAGANDGISQSNTAMFEFHLGWKGVLVEPSRLQFEKCKSVRRNSTVHNCALVSFSHGSNVIDGNFSDQAASCHSGLMSSIIENRRQDNTPVVSVPAKTLNSILQESNSPREIGFLSLDVEGYEKEALSGINFESFRPALIILEEVDWRNQSKIDEWESFMSNFDYKIDRMFDDGERHDFLFYDDRRIS